MGGYTLLELLITGAITSVVAASAVPSIRAFMSARELTEQSGALQVSLQQARDTAIQRNTTVRVCGVTDPLRADDCELAEPVDSYQPPGWGHGWIVVDLNSKEVLARSRTLDVNTRVETTLEQIDFNGSNGGARPTGEFRFCKPGQREQIVRVLMVGRAHKSLGDTKCS